MIPYMLRNMMKTKNIMRVIIMMLADGVGDCSSEVDGDDAADRQYSDGLGSGIFGS